MTRNTVFENSNQFLDILINYPKEKAVPFKKLPNNFQLKLKKYPPNLIVGEYLLLSKFRIKANLKPKWVRINKDDSFSINWKLMISRKENLLLFGKLINFSLTNKVEKFRNIMNSYCDNN